ncbi:MAG: hypothetical protein ACTS22_05840 [Phycisphaerales bacterium]
MIPAPSPAPSPPPALPSVAGHRDARAMFTRVLALWSADLIRLRTTGMDRPGSRSMTTPGPLRRPRDWRSAA